VSRLVDELELELRLLRRKQDKAAGWSTGAYYREIDGDYDSDRFAQFLVKLYENEDIIDELIQEKKDAIHK